MSGKFARRIKRIQAAAGGKQKRAIRGLGGRENETEATPRSRPRNEKMKDPTLGAKTTLLGRSNRI